jgi:hypothetical protein
MHLNSRLEGHWRRKGIRESTVFNSTSVSENHSASKIAAEDEGTRLLCSGTSPLKYNVLHPTIC